MQKNTNLMALAAAVLLAAALPGCAGDVYGHGGRHTGDGQPRQTAAQAADEATAARVRAALAADRRVGAGSLTVKVIDGVVELGGVPRDLQARDLAIRIAERTYGVRRVFNNMVFN